MLDSAGFYERVCEALGISPGRGSQAKIAYMLEITPTAVNYWKKGKMPGLEPLIHVAEIAKRSGASLHWLLTGEGSKYISNLQALPIETFTKQLIERLNKLPNFERRYYSLELIDTIIQNSKQHLKEDRQEQAEEIEEAEEAKGEITILTLPPQPANIPAPALGEKGLLSSEESQRLQRGINRHKGEIMGEKEKRERKARRSNKGKK
jgi:transcriptional regulator with XRE-family HTH domain